MKIRSSVYSDKFELCDPRTGEVVKEVPFTVNVSSVVALVTRRQKELAEVDNNDPEAMGKSFIALLDAIFGEDVTRELADFFKNDYLVMIADLAPVLTDEIFPVFSRYRKAAIDARKKVKK